MVEEILLSWIEKFKELNLNDRFDSAYVSILNRDKGHWDTKYTSYPAALAYIACLSTEQKVTQEQVAEKAGCSKVELHRAYTKIVKRNKITDLG